ncbi:cytochrome P450 [Peterkaempfera bronchialis]|uniref:cytochrome P450 n=1 Tax=Peterkaempfera bronchialis TaxID=2126346 RepID=UPI001E4530A6|nr:cytochrome P450 [Peterkaempfera bronchialis]
MTAPAHPAEPSVPVPPPGCPAHVGAAPDAGSTARVPLYGPEFAADPDTVYAQLREYGPIAPVELAPGVHARLVTSYSTALKVLRGNQTFVKDARRWRALATGEVSADNPVVPMMVYRPNCLYADGEAHTRLRAAITDSLDRADPHELRHYVEQSADSLIDGFGPTGQADLLRDYAKVLPLLVFKQLFGCPPDIGNRMVSGMTAIFDGVEAEKGNVELTQAVIELITLKRERPGADVTSWLLAHPARLTDEEVIHQLVLTMGAGTEPQQNLIANALRLLLADDRFAGDLAGGSLPVEDALDEVLWTTYTPMANYAVHYAVHDVDLDGVRLREGEPIVISLAAANTDPSLQAGHRAGNRAHLAWSAGPHTCPAKSPARLIATVAIEKLLDRLPDLELAVPVDNLAWRPGPFHRALSSLPVRFPRFAAPVQPDENSGARSWHSSPPAPSDSTPPGATSPASQPASAPSAPRRGWSSRMPWRRGR